MSEFPVEKFSYFCYYPPKKSGLVINDFDTKELSVTYVEFPIVLTVIFSKHMLPKSYSFEAPEGQIQNTRLRGLTTPDPGNKGMGNGLGSSCVILIRSYDMLSCLNHFD